MALYKGSGSKATAGSYRPISMTSILIRTFEHLIHRRLVARAGGAQLLRPLPVRLPRRLLHHRRHPLPPHLHPERHAPVSGAGRRHPMPRPLPRHPEGVRPRRPRHPPAPRQGRRHHRQGLAVAALLPLQPPHALRRRVRALGLAAGGVRRAAGLRAEPAPLPHLHQPAAARDILARPQVQPCGAGIFYADDGALCPNPFDPNPPRCPLRGGVHPAPQVPPWPTSTTGATRPPACASAPTSPQLVVFTQRKTADPTPFTGPAAVRLHRQHRQASYNYLGLRLTTRLQLERHAFRPRAEGGAAGLLLPSSAWRWPQPPMVSFTAIRLFVLNYVHGLPSPTASSSGAAAIQPHTSARRTSLQAQLATPLRVGLSLPRTTHQLGTLTLCQVPTVGALVAQGPAQPPRSRTTPCPPMHPTRRLHDSLPTAASPNRTHAATTWTALVPVLSCSPCPVYLTACAMSRTSSSILRIWAAASTPPPSAPPSAHLPAPTMSVAMQFWEHKSDETPHLGASQLHGVPAPHRHRMVQASSSPRLTGRAIKQIARLHSHWEWEAHALLRPPRPYSSSPSLTRPPLPLSSTACPAPSLPPLPRLLSSTVTPRPAGEPSPPSL